MSSPSNQTGSQPLSFGSGWLLPFLANLGSPGDRLLELGCGPGLDAATLMRHGFRVVAFDRAALARAKESAPRASLLRADLSAPLPFRDSSFDAALSSLALHYLPWAQTRGAFEEVCRVLRPGGRFLFRVNATDDYHHGAGQGEELEPHFYRTPTPSFSETKRFFDEPAVRAATDGLFAIEHLAHVIIHRYEEPKRVWECLARRL